MRSLRIGTVAMALAALTMSAVPASAERGERRNPNRGAGSETAQPRGERRGPEVRQDSRPSGRAYEAPRSNGPRYENRVPDSSRGSQPAPRYENRSRDYGRYDNN